MLIMWNGLNTDRTNVQTYLKNTFEAIPGEKDPRYSSKYMCWGTGGKKKKGPHYGIIVERKRLNEKGCIQGILNLETQKQIGKGTAGVIKHFNKTRTDAQLEEIPTLTSEEEQTFNTWLQNVAEVPRCQYAARLKNRKGHNDEKMSAMTQQASSSSSSSKPKRIVKKPMSFDANNSITQQPKNIVAKKSSRMVFVDELIDTSPKKIRGRLFKKPNLAGDDFFNTSFEGENSSSSSSSSSSSNGNKTQSSDPNFTFDPNFNYALGAPFDELPPLKLFGLNLLNGIPTDSSAPDSIPQQQNLSPDIPDLDLGFYENTTDSKELTRRQDFLPSRLLSQAPNKSQSEIRKQDAKSLMPLSERMPVKIVMRPTPKSIVYCHSETAQRDSKTSESSFSPSQQLVKTEKRGSLPEVPDPKPLVTISIDRTNTKLQAMFAVVRDQKALASISPVKPTVKIEKTDNNDTSENEFDTDETMSDGEEKISDDKSELNWEDIEQAWNDAVEMQFEQQADTLKRQCEEKIRAEENEYQQKTLKLKKGFAGTFVGAKNPTSLFSSPTPKMSGQKRKFDGAEPTGKRPKLGHSYFFKPSTSVPITTKAPSSDQTNINKSGKISRELPKHGY